MNEKKMHDLAVFKKLPKWKTHQKQTFSESNMERIEQK